MPALQTTDPEFSALWENFISKDILPKNVLGKEMRYRIILASNIATQAFGLYENMLNEALDNGVSPVEAKEIVYHAVPYVGYAKAFDFILVTNEILTERGVKLPLAGQSTTSAELRFNKGLAVQTGIFGAAISDGFKATPRDEMHVREFLAANCFGDYYTRNGLDVKTRELLTFVMLVSTGGADAQAKAHVQGNLNVGNGRDVLLSAVTQILPYIGYPRTLNGLAAIDAVIPYKGEGQK